MSIACHRVEELYEVRNQEIANVIFPKFKFYCSPASQWFCSCVIGWTERRNFRYRTVGCYECIFSIFSSFLGFLFMIITLFCHTTECIRKFLLHTSQILNFLYLTLYTVTSKDTNECWLRVGMLPSRWPLFNGNPFSMPNLFVGTYGTSTKSSVDCRTFEPGFSLKWSPRFCCIANLSLLSAAIFEPARCAIWHCNLNW